MKSFGELELPELSRIGAGIGAFLVPEELVLQKVAGNRRTINGDEGTVTPRAQLMESARKKLFAGATLAEQEYGRVRARGSLKVEAHFFERRIFTDDSREAVARRIFFFENEVLHHESALSHRPLHEHEEVIRVDGLGEKIERSVFHC